MIGILGQMEVLDQDKNVHSHQVLILVVSKRLGVSQQYTYEFVYTNFHP